MADTATATPVTTPAPAAAVTATTAASPAVTTPAAVATTTTPPTLLDGIIPKTEAAKTEPAKEAAKVESVKHDYSKLEIPKDSLLSATHKEKIAAFASKHSLSPDVAQEVLKQQSADLKEYVDSQVKAYEGVKQKWADELKADPRFAGDKLAEYNKGATEVLNKYGSPELMQMLQESGYAYKKEVASLLSNIYAAMKPDKMVLPGAKSTAPAQDMSPEAMAKRMFPKSNHV